MLVLQQKGSRRNQIEGCDTAKLMTFKVGRKALGTIERRHCFLLRLHLYTMLGSAGRGEESSSRTDLGASRVTAPPENRQ